MRALPASNLCGNSARMNPSRCTSTPVAARVSAKIGFGTVVGGLNTGTDQRRRFVWCTLPVLHVSSRHRSPGAAVDLYDTFMVLWGGVWEPEAAAVLLAGNHD
jgi:hypothetical protein